MHTTNPPAATDQQRSNRSAVRVFFAITLVISAAIVYFIGHRLDNPEAAVLVSLLTTVVVGLASVAFLSRRDRSIGTIPVSRATVIRATLIYVLGLNLSFFAQEIGLFVSKALLGIEVTLYHNSHDWLGDHPDLALWQGAGMIGLGVAGVLGLLVARRSRTGSFSADTGWWTAFHSFVALALNVAFGVVDRGTESGESLAALGLIGWPAAAVGLLAVLALPAIGFALGPKLISLPTRAAESRFVVARRLIVWPALMAVPIIFVFRLSLAEQGLAGVLLLLMTVPWAVVGATQSSLLSTTDGGDDATVAGSVRPAVWATLGSLVVAVALTPGLTVG